MKHAILLGLLFTGACLVLAATIAFFIFATQNSSLPVEKITPPILIKTQCEETGGTFNSEWRSGNDFLVPCACKEMSTWNGARCQTEEEEQAKIDLAVFGVAMARTGEELLMSIKNNSQESVWIFSSCNIPFSALYKRLASNAWEIHYVNPIRGCQGSFQELEPNETRTFALNLESAFESSLFQLNPGTYKLEVSYARRAHLEPEVAREAGTETQILTRVLSHEFTLIKSSELKQGDQCLENKDCQEIECPKQGQIAYCDYNTCQCQQVR